MSAGVYNMLNMTYGGDKGKVLFGLFIGLPLGSILAIILTEKLIYKPWGGIFSV